MDPLSIITASLTLSGEAIQATTAISKFVQRFIHARKDLNQVSDEVKETTSTIQTLGACLIKGAGDDVPSAVLSQIDKGVKSCGKVIHTIRQKLEEYDKQSSWTKARWAAVGRREMKKLQAELEIHTRMISLRMQAVQVYDVRVRFLTSSC